MVENQASIVSPQEVKKLPHPTFKQLLHTHVHQLQFPYLEEVPTVVQKLHAHNIKYLGAVVGVIVGSVECQSIFNY